MKELHYRSALIGGGVTLTIFLFGFLIGNTTAHPRPMPPSTHPKSADEVRADAIQGCAAVQWNHLAQSFRTPENMGRILSECRSAFDTRTTQ